MGIGREYLDPVNLGGFFKMKFNGELIKIVEGHSYEPMPNFSVFWKHRMEVVGRFLIERYIEDMQNAVDDLEDDSEDGPSGPQA